MKKWIGKERKNVNFKTFSPSKTKIFWFEAREIQPLMPIKGSATLFQWNLNPQWYFCSRGRWDVLLLPSDVTTSFSKKLWKLKLRMTILNFVEIQYSNKAIKNTKSHEAIKLPKHWFVSQSKIKNCSTDLPCDPYDVWRPFQSSQRPPCLRPPLLYPFQWGRPTLWRLQIPLCNYLKNKYCFLYIIL